MDSFNTKSVKFQIMQWEILSPALTLKLIEWCRGMDCRYWNLYVTKFLSEEHIFLCHCKHFMMT